MSFITIAGLRESHPRELERIEELFKKVKLKHWKSIELLIQGKSTRVKLALERIYGAPLEDNTKITTRDKALKKLGPDFQRIFRETSLRMEKVGRLRNLLRNASVSEQTDNNSEYSAFLRQNNIYPSKKVYQDRIRGAKSYKLGLQLYQGFYTIWHKHDGKYLSHAMWNEGVGKDYDRESVGKILDIYNLIQGDISQNQRKSFFYSIRSNPHRDKILTDFGEKYNWIPKKVG